MADFRVRFIGDLGNLAQFDRAIRNSAGESARQLELANKRVAAQVGPITDFYSKATADQAGRFILNPKTIVDSYNNTFRQTGDIVNRAIAGYKAVLDKESGKFVIKPIISEQYLGSFDERIGRLDKYEAAMSRVSKTEAAIDRRNLAYMTARVDGLNRILELEQSISGYKGQAGKIAAELEVPFSLNDPESGDRYSKLIARRQEMINELQKGSLINLPQATGPDGKPFYPMPGLGQYAQRDTLTSLIAAKDLSLKLGFEGETRQPILGNRRKEIEREIQYLNDALKLAPNNVAQGIAPLQTALNRYEKAIADETAGIRTEINLLEKEIARLQHIDTVAAGKLQRQVDRLRARNPAYAAAEAARSGVPPIDTNLAEALKSNQLKKELLRGGLGGGFRPGSDDFTKALARQNAAVQDFVRNIRTGVTQVRGSFSQLNAATGEVGVVEKFTADIDKNGKVITRWGGQLSGAGGILKQTVRDFAKVIEWTIATTAVFGTLGLAIKSISTINDLNASLARFAITAQLSATETRELFSDLGQVAISTATPLADLVKVSDEIALATKNAGDSTVQWREKILALTEAVGIFTNLTGEDTVQGADKLSSAFKQLGIAPDELLGVLNKVTAVAGGQSTAINEIVTALGGVAEAGKAAGLSLDEQIAAVQVLSQVTNKSAADVATAFKNLFGSLASVGSEKVLAKYGIALRDEAGNLRGFLQIYREINEARAKGIIPEGQFQDVLRGISGGPRRSPDAAALLANLPAVEAAIEKAASASNEALIANAKILDTNNAKIVQFQNAFNIAVFERFGQVVQELTESITGMLTVLLEIFNKVDPAILATLVQLTALVGAGKLLGVGFLGLKGIASNTWKDISRNIKFATADLVAFSTKHRATQLGYTTVTGGRGGDRYRDPATGRLVSANNLATPYGVFSGAVGGAPGAAVRKGINTLQTSGKAQFGAIAGITAAAVLADKAASGQFDGAKVDPQAIASVLQLAGAVSLATGVFAPLGAAALVAGTAISLFGGQAEEAKDTAKATAIEVYDIIQNLNKAQSNVSTYTRAQKDASKTLSALSATGKTDEQTKIAQTDATNKFVTATLALAQANNEVNKTFDDLLIKVGGLSGAYAQFKNTLGNRALGPNNSQVQNLAEQIATEILRATGSTLYLPTGGVKPLPTIDKIAPLSVTPPPSSSNVREQFIFDKGGAYGQIQTLTAENINKLFDVNASTFKDSVQFEIAASQENFLKLNAVLQDTLKNNPLNLNQTQLDNLIQVINEFIVASDSTIALQTQLLGDQARIQALGSIGALRGDDLQNALTRSQLGVTLSNLIGQADKTPEQIAALGPQYGKSLREAPEIRIGIDQQQVADLISEITRTTSGELNFGEFNTQELEKVGETLLKLNQLFPEISAQGEDALKFAVINLLLEAGVSAEALTEKLGHIPGAIEAISDADDEAVAKLQAARDEALNAYAQRNAGLQQSENSGDFEDNAAGLAALREQSDQAYESQLRLIDVIGSLSTTALQELQNQLANVIGLENATLIGQDQLSAAFINNALAAGVSAEGVVNLQNKLINLLAAIQTISKIRATYRIEGKVTLNLTQYIAAMKALRDSTAAALKNNPFYSPTSAGTTVLALEQLNNAISELEGAQSILNSNLTGINSTINAGTGSNYGKSGKSGGGGGGSGASKPAGPDVSMLDLPEEIANAMNRAALIQEAIKRAKELQSKIPGATSEAQNDIVALLNGTQHILEVRGVKDDLLRKALEELAEIERKRLEFETKADTIRRIRVGAGSFAAIANVPVNSTTGVSLGGAQGPINVTLNLNGTVLTPAQLAQFADLVASALKRQIAG